MFSPVKFALSLFAFITFATLVIAMPSTELRPRTPNAKTFITSTNTLLERTLLPVVYVTSANATSNNITPIITEVVEIVADLVVSLQGIDLTGCGCTTSQILEELAVTLKIIFEPLGIACGYDLNLALLLSNLIAVIIQLVDVVLALVGALVVELLVLLIGNGCAGTILGLNLGPLIDCLGLGGLLGHIL
ncbi:hypothetical protein B0F90DRAFT_1714752 [Multifurca ochricompacta]|uniref:Transmembrane protein n=1 Tax=Multifurca ochricompacta TaxID=376703 RepID=A0AAD4M570_9AGAM|nr:hypothetical protein B0F90DRAFT_1714752 [Multifurca ochricompacta]